MTKNRYKTQGNGNLKLRFDRVDQLAKQTDQLLDVIKRIEHRPEINKLRTLIVRSLGEVTDAQRTKINDQKWVLRNQIDKRHSQQWITKRIPMLVRRKIACSKGSGAFKVLALIPPTFPAISGAIARISRIFGI